MANQQDLSHLFRSMASQKKVSNVIVQKESRALQWINKAEDYEGDEIEIPIEFSLLPGASARASAAIQNAQGSVDGDQFVLDVVNHYVAEKLHNNVKRKLKNKGTFPRVKVERFLQQLLKTASHWRSFFFWRNSTGTLGTIETTGFSSSGKTFKFTDLYLSRHLYRNLKLRVAASTSATPRVGTMTVDKISTVDGTFTIKEASLAAAIPGISAGDVVFRAGDYEGASDSILPYGMDDWFPVGTPGTFLGVDRNISPEGLAGSKVDASAVPDPVDALHLGIEKGMLAEMDMPGKTAIFAHPAQMNRLLTALESYKRYNIVNGSARANIGFKGVGIESGLGSSGVTEIIRDRYVDPTDIWIVHEEAIMEYSVGDPVQVLGTFDNYADDEQQTRAGGLLNYASHNPRALVRIHSNPTNSELI